MCFGRGKPEKIKIGSAELDHRTSCKYLGVHIDKKLNFHEHIDYVVKKLKSSAASSTEFDIFILEKVF